MTPLPAKLWTRVDNGRLIRVNRLIFPGQPCSTLGCRAPTHIIASHKSRGSEGPQGSLPPSGSLGNNCLLCRWCQGCPCFGRAGPGASAPPPQQQSLRGSRAETPGRDSRWIRPKRLGMDTWALGWGTGAELCRGCLVIFLLGGQ